MSGPGAADDAAGAEMRRSRLTVARRCRPRQSTVRAESSSSHLSVVAMSQPQQQQAPRSPAQLKPIPGFPPAQSYAQYQFQLQQYAQQQHAAQMAKQPQSQWKQTAAKSVTKRRDEARDTRRRHRCRAAPCVRSTLTAAAARLLCRLSVCLSAHLSLSSFLASSSMGMGFGMGLFVGGSVGLLHPIFTGGKLDRHAFKRCAENARAEDTQRAVERVLLKPPLTFRSLARLPSRVAGLPVAAWRSASSSPSAR